MDPGEESVWESRRQDAILGSRECPSPSQEQGSVPHTCPHLGGAHGQGGRLAIDPGTLFLKDGSTSMETRRTGGPRETQGGGGGRRDHATELRAAQSRPFDARWVAQGRGCRVHARRLEPTSGKGRGRAPASGSL